jgi:hypothetical protein
MSDEAAEFRKALRAAGQPWSRRGIRTVGAGIFGFLTLNILAEFHVQIPLLAYVVIACLVVIAVGWVMMIIAVLKRRRWAMEQVIVDTPLDEASLPGAS